METFKLTWITNATLPDISDVNNEILGLLARFNPVIFSQDDIGNGVVKYKIEIASVNEDFTSLRPIILNMISDINYDKLQFSVILPEVIGDNLVNGLKNILMIQLPQLIMQTVDDITTSVIESEEQKILVLVPHSRDDFIYAHPVEIENIRSATNLQELLAGTA